MKDSPAPSGSAVAAAMAEALQLAQRGRGLTFPNPMVGAVVLSGGVTAGRGWHRCCGGPHAETEALEQAGGLARGATLVVTLEPCCHHGRTSPCVARILEAGISRVVAAMGDPDPRVDGGGFEALRRGGVEVETGLMAAGAADVNRAYLHYKRTGRSFLRLKLAASLDGRIAAADGSSRWITSEPARARAGVMRSEADAVMVGSGTALADDPSLLPPEGPRQGFCRIIVTGRRPLPAGLKVFDGTARTFVAVAEGSGCGPIPPSAEILPVPAGPGGLDLRALLEKCASMGIGEVMCEGGSALASSLAAGGLVDRLSFFTAPLILGADGIPALDGLGIASMDGAYRVIDASRETLGEDTLLEGRIVHWSDS